MSSPLAVTSTTILSNLPMRVPDGALDGARCPRLLFPSLVHAMLGSLLSWPFGSEHRRSINDDKPGWCRARLSDPSPWYSRGEHDSSTPL